MTQYSREPRTRKNVKWYGFLFPRNLSTKYKSKLLDTGLMKIQEMLKK